ncbi:MAG: hypothetical protein M3Z31_08070, partial [Pseudomonadota bacterium]|nr:hypothetical protein [Pseudomonadota bacterium]
MAMQGFTQSMNRLLVISLSCLALVVVAACATVAEQAGPPTAFRLSSPPLADNGVLSPKNAGNSKG